MSVSLTHLAESHFVQMVSRYSDRFFGLKGLSDLGASRPHEPSPASCEVSHARFANRSFDGASRVDAIVRVGPGRAMAFELKLERRG